MKKLFILFISFLFFQLTSFTPSQAETKNTDTVFPFFDDVEDSATTYANWDRDTLYWDIKITNAHSGQQVWGAR